MIPPGEEGKISVSFNTRNYGGRKKTERVSIYTNDSIHPQFTVIVTGTIDRFAEIAPKQVNLKGSANKQLYVDVEITPNKNERFNLLSVKAKNNNLVKAKLIEPCDSETSRCVVRVENLRTTDGKYRDLIMIQTDSKITPNFSIPVVGDIH